MADVGLNFRCDASPFSLPFCGNLQIAIGLASVDRKGYGAGVGLVHPYPTQLIYPMVSCRFIGVLGEEMHEVLTGKRL